MAAEEPADLTMLYRRHCQCDSLIKIMTNLQSICFGDFLYFFILNLVYKCSPKCLIFCVPGLVCVAKEMHGEFIYVQISLAINIIVLKAAFGLTNTLLNGFQIAL